MKNNWVLIALNATLLIGLDFLNVTSYDMYNNLHFNRILRHTKLVLPKFKIRQNLFTEKRLNDI